jgi:hypothetical protein
MTYTDVSSKDKINAPNVSTSGWNAEMIPGEKIFETGWIFEGTVV